MDALTTVRRRLVTQRLAGAPFESAREVVGWLGAMQAQEFAEAKWSLAERMRGATDSDVEAAFARGDIIRTHALRPTWHFLAREDARWILRLTRPRVHALNRYWYGKLELTAAALAAGHGVIAHMLADGEPRTRRELGQGLAAAGFEHDGLRLGYLLMHAELEELVCNGPRRGKGQTYALFDRRVPAGPNDALAGEAALTELAVRYFRSHGPATIRDFTAWSSLTVAAAKTAVGLAGAALERADDDTGKAWYSAPAPESAPSARLAGAFLIPMYDETIVAYKDLRVVLASQPRAGLLDRAIVIDGATVGSWKRTLAGASATVVATLFRPLGRSETDALGEVVERFGRFLGLPVALETNLVA